MWSSSVIQGVFSIDASTFGIAYSRMTLVFDCWKRIATCVSALQAEIICLDDPPTAPLIAYAPPMAFSQDVQFQYRICAYLVRFDWLDCYPKIKRIP